MLAASLAFLVLVVWASKRLNHYSEIMYGYTPIGLATIGLSMIPYVLLIAGLSLKANDPMNLTYAIAFAGLSVLGIFIWIVKQSSVGVAFLATLMLMIAGLPAVLFLFFSNRNDGYYDEI